MINVNTETGEFGFGGRLTELAAESLGIIKCIYESIKKDDEKAAEAYKHFVKTGFGGVFMSSEEIDKMCDNSIKETEEGVKTLEKLLDKLKALHESHKGEEPSPDDANFKEWLRARDD